MHRVVHSLVIWRGLHPPTPALMVDQVPSIDSTDTTASIDVVLFFSPTTYTVVYTPHVHTRTHTRTHPTYIVGT